jgi:hypothetical protein
MKHEFCAVRPKLCRATKMEAFQFVSYDEIVCRTYNSILHHATEFFVVHVLSKKTFKACLHEK